MNRNQHFYSGLGVSPGKVKGQAKIIKNKADLIKVKEKDILVCKFTTPEYLLQMVKASAIVTEIGSLSSHSSIICGSCNYGQICIGPCRANLKNLFDTDDISNAPKKCPLKLGGNR